MANPLPPAGWYPDPTGSVAARWWDGQRWTEHTRGATGTQAPSAGSAWEGHMDSRHDPSRVAQQASRVTGGPQYTGGGSLFTEPVLVVNQKTKLFEMVNEYSVFDQHGRQIGAVAEIGQSAARKAIRMFTQFDQYMTHRLEVRDADHRPVLLLTRPAKVMKSRVIVSRPDGTEIGSLAQQNVFGKIKFAMTANGYEVGSLRAENWRAWNFAILDANENEVARITKTFEGILRTAFTTADNYVVQIHRPLEDPLRSLVVAAALTVDTALKQDDRSRNLF